MNKQTVPSNQLTIFYTYIHDYELHLLLHSILTLLTFCIVPHTNVITKTRNIRNTITVFLQHKNFLVQEILLILWIELRFSRLLHIRFCFGSKLREYGRNIYVYVACSMNVF